MKKLLSISLVVLVCALFANFFLTPSKAQINEPQASPIEARKQQNFSQLINTAREKGSARVIVGLKTETQPEGALAQAERAKQLLKIKEDQSNFLNRHRQIDKVKQFKSIPFLAFEAKASALEQMQIDPQILSIEEDALAEPTLAESTALVGATTSWTNGFSGSGQTVAVLDTGVDKTHPFLNGKIVAEGCYSSTYAASSTSVCPNGVAESTAPDSGVNCATSVSGCAHGTHVAGIVAGRGTSFSGAAKDANIIAMQVFSRFDNATDCGSNPVPCVLSYTSDQLKALERVLSLSGTMNIASVNMSLGGGQYTASCDAAQPSRKALIDNLRSVGIATVISSGNSGYTNAIGAPACISSAISVGSTDDGSYGTGIDTVSNFSNSSPALTILAPGRWIASSVPNGGYSNYSGTSMSAPHVAGAFAVLKQHKPNASVSQLLNALTTTGKPVTDTRNGITKPRIKIDAALAALSSTRRAQFDYDGDGKADVSVFRPATGSWYISGSANGAFVSQQFGIATDAPASADFDGDGKTDIAVFRPALGGWYVLNSSTNSFTSATFGSNGDLPVPADYDADGKADIAVYRPSNGTWWVTRSNGGAVVSQQHGIAEDKPTLGDFDGDGKADFAVYRPSNGYWYRLNSSNGQFIALQFGISEDKPVPADFDGDGKTDLAVFRPSNGYWYIIQSTTNSFTATQFGIAEDKPAPADFDGDGRIDPAVFRPSSGTWYLLRSMAGFTGIQFGASGDVPAPNAFVR